MSSPTIAEPPVTTDLKFHPGYSRFGAYPVIGSGPRTIVHELPVHPELGPVVLILSTDNFIRVKDGQPPQRLPRIGSIRNQTNEKLMQSLQRIGVQNHFLDTKKLGEEYFDQISASSWGDLYFGDIIFAKRLKMSPFKFQARRIATREYVRRHPGIAEGARFDEPVVEVFEKHGKNLLLILDGANQKIHRYDSQRPCGNNFVDSVVIGKNDIHSITRILRVGEQTARVCFLIIEEAFAKVGYTLGALEIEVGVDHTGAIILGGVITYNKMTLWHGDDPINIIDEEFLGNFLEEDLTKEIVQGIIRQYRAIDDAVANMFGLPDFEKSVP